MTENNIIKGMESFIKKQEELEAKRQLDMVPIRQKYKKAVEEYEKLSMDEKYRIGSYYPRMPSELGTANNNYMFATSLKLLLQEIQEKEK